MGEEGEPVWRAAYERARPALERHASAGGRGVDPKLVVPRVFQADAGTMDEYLGGALSAHAAGALQFLPPARALALQPEVEFGLGMALWYLSVWRRGHTYSEGLFGLRYRDEPSALGYGSWRAFAAAAVLPRALAPRPLRPRSSQAFVAPSAAQRVGWALLHVVLGYARQKAADAMRDARWDDRPDADPRRRAWLLLHRADVLLQVLAVLNAVAFLRDGRYLFLADRLLGLRLVSVNPLAGRVARLDLLDRQLVLEGSSSFLLFVLPLLDLRRLRAVAAFLLSLNPVALFRRVSKREEADPNSAGHPHAPPPPQTGDSVRPCSRCALEPIPLAYAAEPCGHMYCYVCLHALVVANPETATCTACGAFVSAIRRASAADFGFE